MSDSTTNLPLISSGQASKEVTANQLFGAGSPSTLFGIDPRTTAALTFGYLGGKYRKADGTILDVANSTVTLSASATNYILETDGVVSKVTAAPTGWPGPLASGAKALYQIVCDASGVNPAAWPTGGYKDYRTTGIGSGSSSGAVTGPGSSVSGNLASFSGTDGKTLADSGLSVDTDATLAANSNTKLPSQQAVKGYVDAKVAGLSWKQAVRAATTTSGTLASSFANGSAIDGVTLATGDRILIKNQSTGSENGIYVVAASGAPTRATDADSGAELVNATAYVSEGSTQADTQWTCSTNAPITLGTTSLAFAQLTSGGGGSGTPGGSTTQVQFNDGGAFGGDADLTWNKTTNVLAIGSSATPGSVTAPATGATSTGVGLTLSSGAGGATSGDGGALTVQSGSSTSGAGGAINITGGNGGGGSSAANKGGAINVTSGTGSTNAQSGDINIVTGSPSSGSPPATINIKGATASGDVVVISGGSTSSSRTGTGNVTVSAGAASTSGAVGGAVVINGGDGTAGNSGTATVRGGDGATGFTGGNLTLRGGDSTRHTILGAVTPGTLTIRGGNAGGTTNQAAGGAVSIAGGQGGVSAGDGGAVSISGGAPQAGNGGAVNITGAAGVGTNQNGGNVNLTPGAATGSGTPGNVVLNNRGSALATSAIGGFPCMPTCAGTPTGTPAGVPTGTVAMVYDTTANKLWIYNGSWKSATFA